MSLSALTLAYLSLAILLQLAQHLHPIPLIMFTTYVWLTPLFTPNAHIKVFFAQKVDLPMATVGALRQPSIIVV
ncbi:hypothetical protein BGY98DRAFT_1099540 [Russula aff. rugulosa BPL654]|nr:hypothetical protein BGY98DRAFT_1099540 [Russula aff. rugulosa BPL654]